MTTTTTRRENIVIRDFWTGNILSSCRAVETRRDMAHKLIAERDALPVGDPERNALSIRIKRVVGDLAPVRA